jgi:phage terminase large subunit
VTKKKAAAIQQLKDWRENPVKFVWDNFKVEPDAWQRKALEVFPSMDLDKQRMSMQACAGPGKSTLLAWFGWNFLACYAEGNEHPKAAAMSVTGDNLKDNLWSEFSKWQGRSDFLMTAFKWSQERISSVSHPQTWFISARSFPKTANADEQGRTLSGLHSRFILYLVDESGDISPAVLKSAEQGMSTKPKFGKIIQAGNPTSQSGMLHAAATTLRDQWHVIRITGDPDDPDRSPRIDIDWARQQILTYGRDNPWVMAYILGIFPPSQLNTLLGPDEVAAAMKRHLQPSEYSFAQKRLGIDVARFGDDSTIIFPRQGLVSYMPVEMRNSRGPDIAARVINAKSKWKSEIEFVDGTGGYGAGVIDAMYQGGYTPQEIHFSGKATDPRYFNKRSEMWFLMAEWVKRGGVLPNDPILQKELCAPTYGFQNGKLRLEEKEQIKARLGFSPDRADALCLTFALPEMPATVSLPGFTPSTRALTDYDPYERD